MPTALTSSSLPWVRVPVLSVQRTVTLPRFWMAGRRLTRTPCALRARAPRVRLRVTIAGSSSGVRPTARAMEKSSASNSGRCSATLMAKTPTTRISVTRPISSPKARTPCWKSVSGARSASRWAIAP